jgi:hypothetical protein
LKPVFKHINPILHRAATKLKISLFVSVIFLFVFVFNANSQYSVAYNHSVAAAVTGLPNHPADTMSGEKEEDPPYDEVLITVNAFRIGSFEVSALIFGETAYLPVADLFNFLKIKNTVSPDLDSMSGFFVHPDAAFIINRINSTVSYKNQIFQLKAGDLRRTETALYLRSGAFNEIFELDCAFDFRSLSVSLTSKVELPAIREMQQEAMRRNIGRFKGEKKADTVLARSRRFLSIGSADWSFLQTNEVKGENDTRASIRLGAMLFSGELNLHFNYNSRKAFSLDDQFFRWKYVNNESSFLRQFVAGRISGQSISSIYAPVTGVQFTNTPTINRRSFGTYTLSNTTEPGWTVELYLNDILIDYTKADASGFYSFDVPLVYGNTMVKLRFYGPWGEERIQEQYISVPFNFLPAGQLEYTVSAGVVDDANKSKFSRAAVNYGFNTRLTIGGGLEYLSSINSNKTIPFVTASWRVNNKMMLSGEHSYGARSKFIFNYRLPSSLSVDLQYIKYEDQQKAINVSYSDEKKVVISMPVRGKEFSAFSRLTVNQYTLQSLLKNKARLTNAELLFSTSVKGVGANLTTTAVFPGSSDPSMYSNLSLMVRLPGRIILRPQAQYHFKERQMGILKAEAERWISHKGFVNLFYEKSSLTKVSTIGVGFRYNFSFASTSFYARKINNKVVLSEAASGSFMYDGVTNKISASQYITEGRGGLIVVPYLDMNCNGKRDANEPKVVGLKLRVNGGVLKHNKKDTTISITGLEAYNSYFIELDKNSFDNIAWQIRNKTIKVTAEANRFKLIEVPVAVMGEVSGIVAALNGSEEKGLGGIIVHIYNSGSVPVARVLTESDGYFSYLGLAPGSYIARIDEDQLKKINMRVSDSVQSFSIRRGSEGDIVDGLKFVLSTSSPAK